MNKINKFNLRYRVRILLKFNNKFNLFIGNLNFKVISMFNQLEILSDEQSEKLYTIRRYIKNLDSVCIAYSGGVDSTLVASLAFEQLGSKAIAITGVSPALANTLREEARRQAKWIGVKHLEIKTSELDQSSYSKNPKDRCFACKKSSTNIQLTSLKN